MKISALPWTLFLFLLALPVWASPGPPACEARIEALLARMTLEEKLGQLQMLGGDAQGTCPEELFEQARAGRLGSTLNVRGAARVNALQRVAVQESRLGIPILFAFDTIHGHRTVFPIPLGEAAAWDPEVARRSSEIAAREAASTGLKWTFAPMVDIARDARWGRVAEGAGEDPFLGAALARARVQGFQGEDPAHPDRVLACAKHWVAYGAAEAGRDYNSTDLSERTLREVHFPPFQAALQVGAGSVMSAFNDLNGIPTSGNHDTLTGVLRREWGFDGVVVSDYESVRELLFHRQAADEAEAARLGLGSGVDVEMVSRLYGRHLPGEIAAGRFPEAQVDEAVRRVLRTKFRLGLFENPYVDETREARTLLAPEHRRAARRLAARTLVLLKNEGGVLPLSGDLRTLAVVGPLADDPKAVLGSWSGDGRPQDAVSLLEGIRSRLGGKVRLLHEKGVDLDVPGATGNFHSRPADATLAGGTNVVGAEGIDPARLATTPVPPEALDRAVAAARQAEVVVVVVGETAEMSGEAASRTSLDLPGRQMELVQAIHQTGKPYVVVLMNGRPLSLPWIAENSPALLETWFAGTQAGHAIADVLFGEVNPGGKLPITFPRNVGQCPIYYAQKSTGRPPTAEKYTSKYLDVEVTPLFPFGHGLSYSRFELSDLELASAKLEPEEDQTVSVTVRNLGPRTGDEVVQIYVQDVASSLTRPVKELRGFRRLTLQPGQSRRLSFTLEPRDLGFLDRQMRFVVEPGLFKVWAATSSQGGLEASFEVHAPQP